MIEVASVRGFGTRTTPRARGLAIVLIAGLLAVASAAPALAQEIPTRINYQGQLTNENGDPIDNASVTMSFSLYDALSGGTKQWPASGTEDHTVNVSDGLFNVVLGGLNALTISSFSDSLYLNIEVNDGSGLETLSPRQPLVSAPYAFRASIAESVDNGAAADVDLKRNSATKLTLTATGITVTGTFTVSGTSDLQGSVSNSTGDVTVGDNLAITGTTDLQGNVANSTGSLTVNDPLVVTGAADLQGDLSDSGGDLTVADNLVVTGSVDLQGNVLDSGGDLVLNDNVQVNGGVVVGAPTGGSKGFGTINASDVYDDNVLLTDFVFDRYFDGKVRREDQALHGDYEMMSLEQTRAFVRRERHLPTIMGRKEWEAEGRPALGVLANQLWETVETQALHIMELDHALRESETARADLQVSVERLQAAMARLQKSVDALQALGVPETQGNGN